MSSALHVRPKSAAAPTLRSRRSGFALVMALALMAFLVLLVLSLATISQVETGIARAQRDLATAQANALLALDLALGQLTDTLGPDQRTTARAELTLPPEAESGTRQWVGAWSTVDPAAGPIWLVSGEAPDPASALAPEATAFRPTAAHMGVTLRSESALASRVDVPLVPLEVPANFVGGPDVAVGRYAYWIDDASLQASVIGTDFSDYLDPAFADPARPGSLAEARQLARQKGNPGIDLRPLDRPPVAPESLYPWLLSPTSAPFLGNLDALWAEPADTVSWGNLGLLTNPVEGGLKINLSAEDPFGANERFDDVFGNGTALAAWRRYLAPRVLNTRDHGSVLGITPIYPDVAEPPARGEPYTHVAPIPTEIALYVAVYEREGRPSLRYIYEVELWNPYPFALVFIDPENPNANDTRVATVSAINLPEIELESNGIQSGRMPIDDMPRSNQSGPRETTSWLQLSHQASTNNYGGLSALLPGEVFSLKDPDPDVQPQGLWKVPSGTIGAVPEEYSVYMAGFPPAGTRGVTFRLNPGAALNTGRVYFELRDVPYDPFQYQFTSNSFPPYKGVDFSVRVEDMFVFAFHARLGRRWEDATVGTALREVDLRFPIIEYPEQATWLDSTSVNPIEANLSLTGIFSDADLFWDAGERDSTPGTYGDLRFFDYPIGEPTGVADFRLLPFGELPPRALGRPLSADYQVDLNTAFDRYFLTGLNASRPNLPANPGERTVLPQTRLLPAPPPGEKADAAFFTDLAGDTLAAARLYLRGAFNWNSASAEAWAAVFSSEFTVERPWEYTTPNGQAEVWPADAEEAASGGSPIFVRNHTAQTRTERPLSDADLADAGWTSEIIRNSTFRQGLRLPASEWATVLADALVEELRAAATRRGRPFGSLRDWIEDGVLQRAIDQSSLNLDANGQGIPPHSPLSLHQGDLIARLADSGTVRGDTFVIHTYGDVLNPVTGAVEGRARLEAHVQRLYTFTDERIEPSTTDPRELEQPRRFRVLRLRWL